MKRVSKGLLGLVAVLAVAGTIACGDDGAASRASGGGTSGATTTSDRLTAKGVNSPPLPAEAQTAPKIAGGAGVTDAATSETSAGGGPAAQLGALDRKIVFNASLALGAADVTAAYSEASSIASRLGGFIEKSQFSGAKDGDHDNRSAAITIRVPVDKYQDALLAIRTIKDVKVNNENSHSTEITEQYTDLQSRQHTLQTTEQQYLKLLDQAKTVNDILTLTDRLTNIRTQIEQIQGRLNVLDHQADLATIDLSLAPFAVTVNTPPKASGPKSVPEAFADAWAGSLEAMRYVASAGAVLAVAAIWLALPVGLALLGFRTMLRRSRSNRPAPRMTPPPPAAPLA